MPHCQTEYQTSCIGLSQDCSTVGKKDTIRLLQAYQLCQASHQISIAEFMEVISSRQSFALCFCPHTSRKDTRSSSRMTQRCLRNLMRCLAKLISLKETNGVLFTYRGAMSRRHVLCCTTAQSFTLELCHHHLTNIIFFLNHSYNYISSVFFFFLSLFFNIFVNIATLIVEASKHK